MICRRWQSRRVEERRQGKGLYPIPFLSMKIRHQWMEKRPHVTFYDASEIGSLNLSITETRFPLLFWCFSHKLPNFSQPSQYLFIHLKLDKSEQPFKVSFNPFLIYLPSTGILKRSCLGLFDSKFTVLIRGSRKVWEKCAQNSEKIHFLKSGYVRNYCKDLKD